MIALYFTAEPKEEDALKDKIDEFIKAHNTCALAVAPESYDLLDSDLKKDGFGNRQHFEV